MIILPGKQNMNLLHTNIWLAWQHTVLTSEVLLVVSLNPRTVFLFIPVEGFLEAKQRPVGYTGSFSFLPVLEGVAAWTTQTAQNTFLEALFFTRR